MFQERSYRELFNTKRFKAFKIKHLETDLWIGVDIGSYHKAMEEHALMRIMELRQTLDEWIIKEPQFYLSMKPFLPSNEAPFEAREMAAAAARAGVGPMAAVAGLFSREVGTKLLKNFSIKELVIENGGDIFALVKENLLFTVFAGRSVLSEKTGVVVPSGGGEVGICTSSGTVGPSLSFGKADAVAVVGSDVLLSDALATAIGNKVKHPDDIEKALEYTKKFPEVHSVIIICNDKMGVRGEYEIKLIK